MHPSIWLAVLVVVCGALAYHNARAWVWTIALAVLATLARRNPSIPVVVYPVPVQGLWAWLRGFISWQAYRASRRTDNVLERDYQLKRAMGFGPEHFLRIRKLLPARPVFG